MNNSELFKSRKKRKFAIIITLVTCILIIATIFIIPIAITIKNKSDFYKKLKNITIQFPTSYNIYKNQNLEIIPKIINAPNEWIKDFKYQWLISSDAQVWNNINSFNTSIPGNNETLSINYNDLLKNFNNKKIKLQITYKDEKINSIFTNITVSDKYQKINISIPKNIEVNENMEFSLTPTISDIQSPYKIDDLQYKWLISDNNQQYTSFPNQTNNKLFIPANHATLALNDKIIKLQVSYPNDPNNIFESNPGYISIKKISDIYLNKLQFYSGKSLTPMGFDKIISPVIDRWSTNFFEIQTLTNEYKYACVLLPYSIEDFELKKYHLSPNTTIQWQIIENASAFNMTKDKNNHYYFYNNNWNPLYTSDIKTKIRANFYDGSNFLFNIDVKFSFYTGLKQFDDNIRLFSTLTNDSFINNLWQTQVATYPNSNYTSITNDHIYIKNNSVRINLKNNERHIKIRLPLKLLAKYYLCINPNLENVGDIIIDTPSRVPGWFVNKKNDYIEITNMFTMTDGPNIFTLPMWYTYNNTTYQQELLFNCFINPR